MTTEIVSSEPLTPARIPNVAPAISMDTKLGQRLKPGEAINFDYDTFRSTAHERGLTDEQIRKLHIDIVDPSYQTDGAGGRFHKPTEDMPPLAEVTFNPKTKRSVARHNNALAHETQHYIDDEAGILPDHSDNDVYAEAIRQGRIAKRIMQLGALETAGAFIGLGPGAAVLVGPPTATVGLMKAQLYGGYHDDPMEQKAREAEKIFGDRPIIMVSQAKQQ